jgi:hypothetical protein
MWVVEIESERLERQDPKRGEDSVIYEDQEDNIPSDSLVVISRAPIPFDENPFVVPQPLSRSTSMCFDKMDPGCTNLVKPMAGNGGHQKRLTVNQAQNVTGHVMMEKRQRGGEKLEALTE